MGSLDTTSQHDAHLFDSNCKICTGKQAAPRGAELERRTKVKVSHEVKMSTAAKRVRRESTKEEIDEVGILYLLFFYSLIVT